MQRALFSLIASAALANAALAAPPSAGPAPATLPTPYSAQQIHDAWLPGFSVEMRTTEAGVVSSTRMTVISATPEAGVIRSESFAADGSASGPPSESAAKWSELRDHALFDAAKATRERAECRSLLGALPGWRYVVPQPDAGTLTMCFADATPGPPVEFEMIRDGKLLSRTEHVSYGPAQSGAKEKL